MEEKIDKEPRPNSNWLLIESRDDLELYEVSDALQKILDKVDYQDIIELSPYETTLWLQHFAYVISDQYTLSVKQLLTTHDKWLKTIEYHSNIKEDKFIEFEGKNFDNWTLTEFLNYVVNYFTVDELSVLDINNTA